MCYFHIVVGVLLPAIGEAFTGRCVVSTTTSDTGHDKGARVIFRGS